MQYLKYILLGILFGIIMVKAEIISWFRIFEMFRFESFHMYGIIGSAVLLGSLGIYLLKRSKMKSLSGNDLVFSSKELNIKGNLLGGILFGLGWALVGACPGPMFVLLGAGYIPILLVIFGALLGTFTYGAVNKKLPH